MEGTNWFDKMMNNKRTVLQIIKLINISFLFYSLVTYSIGVGVYYYLGRSIDLWGYLLGALIIFTSLISAYYLNEYFRETTLKEFQKERNWINKNFYLLLGITVLAIGAVVSFLLISLTGGSIILLLFLGSYLILSLLFSIPPFSFQKKGLAFLIYEIYIVILSPAFGNFLQSGAIHSIILLLTFPSVFLTFASFIALSLEHYYEDIKNNTRTVLTILGWQRGMNLHNYSILLTYLSFSLVAVLGLPWRLSIVVFLSLPFALIQLWEMNRIRDGYKPRWKLLKISSIASVSSLAYFILFFLWLG